MFSGVNHLLAALPPQALGLLDLKAISLAHGKVLLERGDPIERVYFPKSGMISLVVVTKEGQVVETGIIGREGALGVQRGLGKRQSFTKAAVQIDGSFLTMPADKFELAVASSTPIRAMINRYTEVLWAEAQQTTACNAVHTASSRLSRVLLESAGSVGSDQLPLTQEFLSQMLGVCRTTVTVLAQSLQRKGAIKYRRGKISIVNRSALEACACECHKIIENIHAETAFAE
jgi:CRP-like cAMP-binding protein